LAHGEQNNGTIKLRLFVRPTVLVSTAILRGTSWSC